MKFGVIVFPGSNCDTDAYHAVKDVVGADCDFIWHDSVKLDDFDAVILPGGFSYGDYLRSGALARFSPVMSPLMDFVEKSRLVIGICNGFQILTEAGLLPGQLLSNDVLEFRCQWVNLRVDNAGTPFTSLYKPGEVVRMPIAHHDGNYYADESVLADLERGGQVVLRYVDAGGNPVREANPNGAARNIAAIVNKKGNVLGMMPHPERCSEALLGGEDGRRVFLSMVDSLSKGTLAGRGRS